MGFVYFIVKQPPLQMKIYHTDSGRNVPTQGNVLKFYSDNVKSRFPESATTEVINRKQKETKHYLELNYKFKFKCCNICSTQFNNINKLYIYIRHFNMDRLHIIDKIGKNTD